MCRRNGLERNRRCGWLGIEESPNGAPVWARRQLTLGTCPQSYITAESVTMLEEFAVWRRLGRLAFGELTARQVDGFLILDEALTEELRNGREVSRSIVGKLR